MTNKQAIKWLKDYLKNGYFSMPQYEQALEMAIQALSQEPRELLIIKSNILLHQDDRKKLAESIKREKESGVIILPPYFEPLLVPADIEINTEQEPCEDAISRKDAEQMFRNIRSHLKPQDYKSAEEFNTRDLMLLNAEQMIHALPSVTPKSIVCDDAISREAALEKMADYVASGYADSAEDFEEYSRIICQLPSVTQKSGKWNEYYTSQKGNNVFNCKECGHTFVVMQGKDNMNFCPNCGAKMESEE